MYSKLDWLFSNSDSEIFFVGAVELEGLYIRKDALKEFDLPGIEVKWGYIGNITLRIPSYRNYRY